MRLLAVRLVVAALLTALPAMAASHSNLSSGTTATQGSQAKHVQDYADRTLARIVPGHTTKAEVAALLGSPWRDTALDEEDVMPGDPSVLVWEYRGHGSKGAYRVHIQFDKRDIATLIAKIPEKTGRAVARVAKPATAAAKP